MFDPAILTDAAGLDIEADIVEQGYASLLYEVSVHQIS